MLAATVPVVEVLPVSHLLTVVGLKMVFLLMVDVLVNRFPHVLECTNRTLLFPFTLVYLSLHIQAGMSTTVILLCQTVVIFD